MRRSRRNTSSGPICSPFAEAETVRQALEEVKHDAPALFEKLRNGICFFPGEERRDDTPAIEALQDPDSKIRLAAIMYLERVGARVGNKHVGAMGQTDAEIGTRLFLMWEPDREGDVDGTICILRQFLQDPKAEVRIAAIKKVEDLGPDLAGEFISDMAAALRDEETTVRHEALITLEAFGVEAGAATEAVVDLMLRDKHRPNRVLAAQVQNQIDPQPKAPGRGIPPKDMKAVSLLLNRVQTGESPEEIISILRKIGPAAGGLRSRLEQKLREQDPVIEHARLDLGAKEDAKSKLSPTYQRAYEAYDHACRKTEKELTLEEAYEWLKEEGKGFEDYDLPKSSETFARYVGRARTFHKKQVNMARRGRGGRSIVRASEIKDRTKADSSE